MRVRGRDAQREAERFAIDLEAALLGLLGVRRQGERDGERQRRQAHGRAGQAALATAGAAPARQRASRPSSFFCAAAALRALTWP